MLHLPLRKKHSDELDKGEAITEKINWVKTFPTAFLRQPLSLTWSLLECVLLLLRFRFWHFEINSRQRDGFFFYNFMKPGWKHFNQACRGPDTGDGRDRSIMSGALPGVPLKASLLSYLKSSKSAIPTTFTDYINLLKYILSKKKKKKKKKNSLWKCCSSWFC